MDALREYILSVTAAAILCGILRTLIGEKGTAAGIVKLICGLYLAFTVIRPVAQVELSEFSFFTAEIAEDAQEAVNAGEDFVRDSVSHIIKSETEAYILDKARTYGAEIQVEVILSDATQPIPEKIKIKGALSPYVKTQLQSMITEDLGIPKENLSWMK